MYMPIETDKIEVQYDQYDNTYGSSLSSSLPPLPSSSLSSKISKSRLTLLSMLLFSLSIIITITVTRYNTMKATLNRVTAFKQVFHSDIPTIYWGTVTKPYPTGAFWTNLVVKSGDGAIGVFPYGIKTLDTGIQVSYGSSRRQVSSTSITDIFAIDLQISANEAYVSRGIEKYDNISVTMAYKTIGLGKYKTHLVKGSPFITVIFEGTTPIISSKSMQIINVDAKIFKGSLGVQYILTLGNFQKWLLYCSEPIVFSWKDNILSGLSPIRGVVRVAILPNQNSESAFDKLINYVQKYPTGANMTLCYNSANQGIVTYNYNTIGIGSLLMYSLPHHTQIMIYPIDNDEQKQAQLALTPIWSIKGKLKVIIGDSWKLQYTLPKVDWHYSLTEKLSTVQLDDIAKNMILDIKQILPTATDSYSFGKQVGRMARLALIADFLGIADARQQALSVLESSLGTWLQSLNADTLLYDKTYGGVITTNGLADPMSEYGTGWYNDHHFHYGYFIYAAAVIARFDTPFWDLNKSAIDTLVRDICNPDSTDPDFPFARHKDFFDGHSWASGLFQQANGKGQESSSEAINAYYAVYLYGLAAGYDDLKKFASLLLAMEIQSVQTYWHMSNDNIYDNIFSIGRMVGNVGALDVTQSTWFGSEPEFVHGINMMPITPVTSLLFDQAYVDLQWPVLEHRVPPPVSPTLQKCESNPQCQALSLLGLCCPNPAGIMLSCCESGPNGSRMQDEWKGLLYIDHAVVDRDRAWTEITNAGGFGIGGSKSNSLFWAASRPPPIPYNTTHIDPKNAVKPACSANSACDALGMINDCCPTEKGIYLGCCPANGL